MRLARQKTIRQVAALLMAAVFVQGLVGAFAHFELQAHVWCPEHEKITHEIAHVVGSTGEDGSPVTEATRGADRVRSDSDAPIDGRGGPEECELLVWLHNSLISTPALQPELPEPPALSDRNTSNAPDEHELVRRTIPLKFVSPINSPPHT